MNKYEQENKNLGIFHYCEPTELYNIPPKYYKFTGHIQHLKSNIALKPIHNIAYICLI